MRLVCVSCSYISSEGGYGGQVQALFPIIVNIESAVKSPTEQPQEQPSWKSTNSACYGFLKGFPMPGKVQEVLDFSGLTGFFSVAEVTCIRQQLCCDYWIIIWCQLAMGAVALSSDAGQWQWAVVSSQSRDHEGNNWDLSVSALCLQVLMFHRLDVSAYQVIKPS